MSTELSPSQDDSELTCDSIFRSGLKFWQPRRGYRFNVDSVLLADFVKTQLADVAPPSGPSSRRVLDIGTGCGILAIAMAAARPDWTVEAIEIQATMAALAKRNSDENDVSVLVHHGDVRDGKLPGGAYDLIVANPPYRALADGPTSPDPALATARHEVSLDVQALALQSRRMLRPNGSLAMIFPAPRLPDLYAAFDERSLSPTVLRAVHPFADRDAELVLVLAKKAARPPLRIIPPLIVYQAPNQYSDEVDALLDPNP